MNRTIHLDMLRGFAILGILLININNFGIPEIRFESAYSLLKTNWMNYSTWFISTVFFEGKMRALLCLLFGAGFIMISNKQNDEKAFSKILYKRMLVLFLIGLFDVLVFHWTGDILWEYALIGFIVIPLRKLRSRYILLISALIWLGFTINQNQRFFNNRNKLEVYKEVLLLKENNKKIPAEKEKIFEEFKNTIEHLPPFSDSVLMEFKKADREQLIAKQGNYIQSFENTIEESKIALDPLFYIGFLEEMAPILLGMALFKLGWISLIINIKKSKKMLLTGLGIGLPLAFYLIFTRIESKNDFINLLSTGIIGRTLPYQLSKILIPIGYIGLIQLIIHNQLFKNAVTLIANCGKLPLTNYLMQSIICTLIFNGYGLGLFGKLELYQLTFVVFLVWVCNITFSYWWLKSNVTGPVEWIWRKLTY